MLIYKAAYTFDEEDENGWVMGQVLDFPGTITQSRGLDDARRMLASALVDMAETNLMDGRPLPQPDNSLSDPNADLEEPIYLLLNASSHVRIVPEEVTAEAGQAHPTPRTARVCSQA
jgi:predicted RNase H-like HicB family nuclease